jgi:hypothetical protein
VAIFIPNAFFPVIGALPIRVVVAVVVIAVVFELLNVAVPVIGVVLNAKLIELINLHTTLWDLSPLDPARDKRGSSGCGRNIQNEALCRLTDLSILWSGQSIQTDQARSIAMAE